MTDIFISYDSDDRDRIAPLVTIFQAEGWRVWWDRDLVVGPRYDEEIDKALNEASCIVVAWSRNSIKSRWVRDEADHGLSRDALMPLLIDDVQPPLGFRGAQAAKLIDWPALTGELDRLLAGIRHHLDSIRPTENPAAYELYRQGVERALGYNKWDTRSAIEMLRHATNLDAEFADAWAYLGEACLNSVIFFDDEFELWQEAEDAAVKALSLDSDNIVAKTVQGRLLWSAAKGYRNRDALRAFDRIRHRTDAHHAQIWQCLVFSHVGLSAEAQARLERIVAANPDDPLAQFFLSQASLYLGQSDEALEQHARAISLDPTNQVISLHYPSTWIAAGELNQAEASVENATKIGGSDPILTSSQALIWAKRGEEKKAREACQLAMREVEADGRPKVHTHHVFHNLGAALSLTGDPEAAIDQIRNAAETGFPNFHVFDEDPHLHGLKGKAGFDDLMGQLKTDCDDYRSEFG